MANNQGANGPRVGASTGRQRNSLVNLSSKQRSTAMPGGFVPPISPGSALGLGAQTAATQYDYLAKLAALRQQKAAIVGQFRQERAGIRAALPDAVAAAANAAAERGITGSSIDLAGRARAHTEAAAALAAARQNRALGIMGVQQGRLGASADYNLALANIEAQRRAEQSMLAVQAFQSDAYDAAQANYGAIYRQLLEAIQDQRSGRQPRRRSGLAPAEIGAARTARLLREGY